MEDLVSFPAHPWLSRVIMDKSYRAISNNVLRQNFDVSAQRSCSLAQVSPELCWHLQGRVALIDFALLPQEGPWASRLLPKNSADGGCYTIYSKSHELSLLLKFE